MTYKISVFDDDWNYKPKHRALTGWLAKNWSRNIKKSLPKLMGACDVSGYVGALPPQLRSVLNPSDISSVTIKFRWALDCVVAKKFKIFEHKVTDQVYEIPEIGQLFNTKCFVEVKGHNNKNGVPHVLGRPWTGAVGVVCKLSFPELRLEYALKLFNKDTWVSRHNLHGAFAEIATAFGACRAEPRDNNPVYMASLCGRQYMLSLWQNECDYTPLQRKNKFEIFTTSDGELYEQNFRAGRRIDYGGTYQTGYGAAKYPVRKLCRKMIYAAEKNDVSAMVEMQNNARGYVAKQQFNQAIDCIRETRSFWYDYFVYNFVNAYRIK